MRKTLELSREYLTHIQSEKNNELKVIKIIQEILKSDSLEEKNISLNRNEVARLLGVSINVILYWERNGLLEVPRSKNGYRVYGEDELKLLRVIKALRQENYSTQCIGRMLKKLKTKSKGSDMFLSKETEDSDDWLLSSLSEAESDAKKFIGYIGELISKKQNMKEDVKNVKPGEIITFGAYPQTADGADLIPIKWRVLQNSGSELFILSEYILDSKRYYSDFLDITWRDSDLRKWLNDEFYNAAFNDSEKKFIKTTHCMDNGEGSTDTEDEVFLLSVSEVKELTDKIGEDSLSAKRRAIGTEFSKIKKNDGCHLYVYDKKFRYNYIIENGEEFGCSWWWLRTQGNTSSRACFVGTRSSIRSYGRVNLACYGVRPALKININAY